MQRILISYDFTTAGWKVAKGGMFLMDESHLNTQVAAIVERILDLCHAPTAEDYRALAQFIGFNKGDNAYIYPVTPGCVHIGHLLDTVV
jgi:hypothetical protein